MPAVASADSANPSDRASQGSTSSSTSTATPSARVRARGRWRPSRPAPPSPSPRPAARSARSGRAARTRGPRRTPTSTSPRPALRTTARAPATNPTTRVRLVPRDGEQVGQPGRAEVVRHVVGQPAVLAVDERRHQRSWTGARLETAVRIADRSWSTAANIGGGPATTSGGPRVMSTAARSDPSARSRRPGTRTRLSSRTPAQRVSRDDDHRCPQSDTASPARDLQQGRAEAHVARAPAMHRPPGPSAPGPVRAPTPAGGRGRRPAWSRSTRRAGRSSRPRRPPRPATLPASPAGGRAVAGG